MSANPESADKQGQFHSRVPPANPLSTSGHQLGQQVGNEAVPEFRAKTYPAGTAPKEHTHQPNPIQEIPSQALNPDATEFGRTEALADMPGATSGEVYNASTFSRPMQGQTSREVRGAHAGANKKERSGLEGGGVTATTSDETVEGRARALGADLPEGVERGMKGNVRAPAAEESKPATAGEVASEKRRA